jgi:AraC family transcriptional regulator
MNQAVYIPSKHYLKTHEFSGFILSEALYPSKLKQPRHTHEFASFSFVLNGNYIENYEREAEIRQPLTFVFRPPQESHSVEYQNESVRILSVQFDFNQLSRVREYSNVLDSPAIRRTETIAWLGKRLHQEFRRMDALSGLAIEGLILEILVEAARSRTGAIEKKMPCWLANAKDFLHAHFDESLTLEEIAKISGVHPVYLARVFHKNFGCTIGEYLRTLRVEFACRQLCSTDAPLSEIALAAGFSDQSHLTKTFKSRYGLTPSEYRKISRNG